MSIDGEPLPESFIAWVLEDLNRAGDWLPEGAVFAVRQFPDEIVPRLIEALQAAVAMCREGKKPEGRLPFLALFLLTELRAKQALGVIVEAFSLPDDAPDDLFGDAVFEVFPRTLVSLSDDPPALIDGLTGNREVAEAVRSAACGSYRHLVRDGRLSRADAVERLAGHLRRAVDLGDCYITVPLICTLNDLYPVEAMDVIALAYQRGVVDEFFINMQDVQDSLAADDAPSCPRLKQLGPSGIDDTLLELSRWASFRPHAHMDNSQEDDDEEEDADDYDESEEYDESDEYDDAYDKDDWEEPHDGGRIEPGDSPEWPFPFTSATPPAWARPAASPPEVPCPIRNETPRVGRNEPCPCGSGKKYKKCCGSRANSP
jgi:hypothetical protein